MSLSLTLSVSCSHFVIHRPSSSLLFASCPSATISDKRYDRFHRRRASGFIFPSFGFCLPCFTPLSSLSFLFLRRLVPVSHLSLLIMVPFFSYLSFFCFSSRLLSLSLTHYRCVSEAARLSPQSTRVDNVPSLFPHPLSFVSVCWTRTVNQLKRRCVRVESTQHAAIADVFHRDEVNVLSNIFVSHDCPLAPLPTHTHTEKNTLEQTRETDKERAAQVRKERRQASAEE